MARESPLDPLICLSATERVHPMGPANNSTFGGGWGESGDRYQVSGIPDSVRSPIHCVPTGSLTCGPRLVGVPGGEEGQVSNTLDR